MNVQPAVEQAARQAVELVMSEIKGARAAVVSTEDGFEVAAVVHNTAETARLSAMASSLAALGAIAGEESHLGACGSIVIEAERGYVVVLQARRSDVTLVLSVVTDREAITGQIIYVSRQAVAVLEQA